MTEIDPTAAAAREPPPPAVTAAPTAPPPARRNRIDRQDLFYGLAGAAAALFLLTLRFAPELPGLWGDIVTAIEQSHQERPAPVVTAPPAPPLPDDPLALYPADLVQEVTQTTSEFDGAFSRTFRGKPEELCRSLVALGLTGAKFTRNPPVLGGWACDTDLVELPGGSGKPDVLPSSLFASLRGDRSDRLVFARFKLNLTDPANADAARNRFQQVLAGFCAVFGWELPDKALTAIKAMRSDRLAERGINFDIRREWGETPRLNVVLSADDASGILDASAFAGSLSILKPRKAPPPKPGPARLPDVSTIEAQVGSTESPASGNPDGSGVIDDIAR